MGLSTQSDVELPASGTPGDYGVFYDRHLGVVRSYVGARVRQPEIIFDLVAETFARALEKRVQPCVGAAAVACYGW
jgi:RNA polymerase sigma-70 factor (ECF subfamily)